MSHGRRPLRRLDEADFAELKNLLERPLPKIKFRYSAFDGIACHRQPFLKCRLFILAVRGLPADWPDRSAYRAARLFASARLPEILRDLKENRSHGPSVASSLARIDAAARLLADAAAKRRRT